MTRPVPTGGPCGLLGSAVRWKSVSNQSAHHSQVFPVIEKRPKLLGGNASTGEVPA